MPPFFEDSIKPQPEVVEAHCEGEEPRYGVDPDASANGVERLLLMRSAEKELNAALSEK